MTCAQRLPLLLAALLVLVAGCRHDPSLSLEPARPATPSSAPAPAPPPAISPTPLLAASEVIGRSVQGRDIDCVTVGDGETVVMLIASIHGNEPAGTPLLRRLAREAAGNPTPAWMRDRALVIIPIANPDGFAMQRRGNAHGVDLNRNFPAASFMARRRHGGQPLSEPESLALHDAIEAWRPDRIVSFHQPLACIDFDGDGAALAAAMSAAMDADHRLPVRKLGAYPGSLGSFAGEDLRIPTITVELPAAAQRLDEETLWRRYGPMLIAAVEQQP